MTGGKREARSRRFTHSLGRMVMVAGLVWGVSAPLATGQEASEGTASAASTAEAKATPDEAMQKRYDEFTKMLTGAKLVGRFTIIGKGDSGEEEYTIKEVRKLKDGDYWLFKAQIKYGGNKPYTVPIPLEVKWADDTPMITLTDFKILGQGPFSSRVIFYNGKYAGTWSHGEVGGHMFGRIVRPDVSASAGDSGAADQ